MYNFVYTLNYWNKAAKTDAFGKICHSYKREKAFWAHQPDVQKWGLKKDMSFLDFGCGLGRIVKTVAPLVKEYYGVDVSRNLIEKAKHHHETYINVQFFVNNGRNLDLFDDDKFDSVLENLVFIHLRKNLIVKYVNEIYRILKPGGVFISRSLPKKENYVNGLSFKEMKKVFSIFEEVTVKHKRCVWQLITTKL